MRFRILMGKPFLQARGMKKIQKSCHQALANNAHVRFAICER
jgi:hypothetical protein